jgi:glycosyltransferase involved in cell wall biosynthesis
MDITVVVTSCNRYDLLDRTLSSFRQFNTDPLVKRILVVEDGAGDPTEVCRRFGADVLTIGSRVGQAQAIDLAYAQVDTPYIFHLEDDWEFYRPGFIERSRLFLESDPSTILVWLRAWNDTNKHPLSFKAPDGSMGVLSYDFATWWHGFSWNPGLRRLADYKRLGSFVQRRVDEYPWAPGGAHEAAASVFYRELGYRAVILDEGGYVRHIGIGRHVIPPDNVSCEAVDSHE